MRKNLVKKLVLLDFGGVIGPDSHVGAYNQNELEKLTGLTAEELNAFQDHIALNVGKKTLTETFELIAENSKINPKPTVAALLTAYKKGVVFYPGAGEMIRELSRAGYHVCLLTNNSHEGIAHVRNLLHDENLFCVIVYGSAEMRLSKPNPEIFIRACTAEKVHPSECWFVDDRRENWVTAAALGLSVIQVMRPETAADTAKTISACRAMFLEQGVLRANETPFSEHLNRGKFPSLFGLMGNAVVKYHPETQKMNRVDQANADGNQQKRCLYESRLAKLIVESSENYWLPAYQKINQLFLSDFDRKNNSSQLHSYRNYFSQIEKILKKESVLQNKAKTHTNAELRNALTNLYSKTPFDLTTVSQFYYGVWLLEYGYAPLEPFVFLVDGKCVSQGSMRMLSLFPDMVHNQDSRADAYLLAQNWLTCGTPQLRGRQLRANAPSPANSTTIGIIRDDDPAADSLRTKPHYSAKTLFEPARTHPISQRLEAMGAPIISGSSGTLGRNVYMFAPLVATGLLTHQELMHYIMGFAADLVYRGHHSFEEVAIVAGEILFSLKSHLDPIRDPITFYEQLLTEDFIASDEYQAFRNEHENFFEASFGPS